MEQHLNKRHVKLPFAATPCLNKNGTLVVDDASEDVRFKNNPLVTGETEIIFYAGVSLINSEGHALGTLCVIGHKPRSLSAEQLSALKTLAKQALMLMEMRRKNQQLENQNQELARTNAALQEFARRTVHDIKNPLTSIMLNSQTLTLRFKDKIDYRTIRLAEMIISSAKELTILINELLAESLTAHQSYKEN